MYKKLLFLVVLLTGLISFFTSTIFEVHIRNGSIPSWFVYLVIPLIHIIFLFLFAIIAIKNIYQKDKNIVKIIIVLWCIALWLFFVLDGKWSKYKRYTSKKWHPSVGVGEHRVPNDNKD